MYVNKQQDNQVEFLLIAQYIYNSAVSLATGFLPFFANYSYKLKIGNTTDNPASVSKDTRIKAKRIGLIYKTILD